MELPEFLRARLDEDQERAERGQWTAQFLSQGGAKDPGSRQAFAKAIEREGGRSPAWVLADVAAKRRIVDEHQRRPDYTPQAIARYAAEHPEIAERASCERCHVLYDDAEIDENPCGAVDWPCLTLRLLAAPHAGHPDFDQAWKVD